MLFIVFIAAVFGVLNVLFLFILVALNEFFLLALSAGKYSLLAVFSLVILFILIAVSPNIDPVNIDLITIVVIVLFSTTALFLTFRMYKLYRTRIGRFTSDNKRHMFVPINTSINGGAPIYLN